MPNCNNRQCLLSLLFLMIILMNSTMGCFLNSCPYRRYGRSPTCGQCGENNEGLCVAQGVCCIANACIDTDECRRDEEECQIPQCTISGLNGICISPSMCCVGRICRENLQCLTGKDRKKTIR